MLFDLSQTSDTHAVSVIAIVMESTEVETLTDEFVFDSISATSASTSETPALEITIENSERVSSTMSEDGFSESNAWKTISKVKTVSVFTNPPTSGILYKFSTTALDESIMG
jgi:hypothetical protein